MQRLKLSRIRRSRREVPRRQMSLLDVSLRNAGLRIVPRQQVSLLQMTRRHMPGLTSTLHLCRRHLAMLHLHLWG